MSRPLVSVVVPTHNRAALLERCLEALLLQDFDPSAYEIIIVDDAASPTTHAQVARWKKRAEPSALRAVSASRRAVPVLWNGADGGDNEGLHLGDLPDYPASAEISYLSNHTLHGPAAARNAGWRFARGQIIAFTDDDCQPATGWLAAGVGAILAGADAASGKIIMPIPEVPSDYQKDAAGLATAEFVTANCFYRRSLLEAVGGFDPRFEIAWREDTDLQFAAMERGYRLVYAPDAVVYHPVRNAAWGISIRQQKKSQYNALLYKKHPTLYRDKISARPPLRYYLTVLSLVTGIFGFGLRRRLGAALGLAAWTGLTVRFTIQRLRGTRRDPSHTAEMILTSMLIPILSVYWRLRGAIRFRVWFL